MSRRMSDTTKTPAYSLPTSTTIPPIASFCSLHSSVTFSLGAVRVYTSDRIPQTFFVSMAISTYPPMPHEAPHVLRTCEEVVVGTFVAMVSDVSRDLLLALTCVRHCDLSLELTCCETSWLASCAQDR
jgi:hypothetical protein